MFEKQIKQYKERYQKINPKNKKKAGILLIFLGITQFINPFVSGIILIIIGIKLLKDSRQKV